MLNKDYKILYEGLKIINEEHRILNGKLMKENKQLKSIIKTLMKEYDLEPTEYVENLLKGDSMNKEKIVIDSGYLIHYLNDREFYEYDSLYISTLEYLDKLQKENKQLKERIDKVTEYLEYNNDGLYTFEPDYDYEENIVGNYEPSSYKEDLLDILRGDENV